MSEPIIFETPPDEVCVTSNGTHAFINLDRVSTPLTKGQLIDILQYGKRALEIMLQFEKAGQIRFTEGEPE